MGGCIYIISIGWLVGWLVGWLPIQGCGRLVAGIAGSNPARGMDVCLLYLYVVLSCVGRDLCDGLNTLPEESYRVYLYV
jgi:hypothetical protein